MSRTTRTITTKAEAKTAVPDDVRVILAMRSPDQRTFRVATIEETLADGRYWAWITGPIQTKIGRDHSKHTGFHSCTDPSEVPAELAPLLAGPQGLRAALTAAGGEDR